MIRLFLLIIAVSFLFACSSSDDEVTLPKTGFELEEKILGKWDVDLSKSENRSGEKQDAEICQFFSFIFNADGSFIINHSLGTITGNYVVESENFISLGNTGSIGNIRFTSSGAAFAITLTNYCSGNITVIRHQDFVEGTCASFLSCHDKTYWVNTEDEEVTFLYFNDWREEDFFYRYSFFPSLECKEIIETDSENMTSVMLYHVIEELKFLLEGETISIYTYTFLESGEVLEEIETDEGTVSQIYEPAVQSDMDAYNGYTSCGDKTYIPDDIFESLLISLGHDDVMDNYVLTENISGIETFYISDSNFPEDLENLIGLEDFTAVKDLDIQMRSLAEIDLSGNAYLERLFLGSPALTNLDLSQNSGLQSLYLEFADIRALDLSHNPELRSVELQLMPITSLDISNNMKLEMLTIEGGEFKELTSTENSVLWHLNLSDNEIENIEVYKFPNLKELLLSGNKIAAIELSALNFLEHLDVTGNNLTHLDFTNNSKLRELWLGSNKLDQLNVADNSDLQFLDASDNPSLFCIQIAEVHQTRLTSENGPGPWRKDDTAEFSLDCD